MHFLARARYGLYLLSFFVWGAAMAQGPPFECNGHLILTQFTGGPPTTIYDVEVTGNQAIFQPITQHNIEHNSSGYNRYDNFIYCIDPATRTIYRLFSDGTLQNMGVPPGLGNTSGLVAGDCDTNGFYLLSGGGNSQLFTLDVTGTNATVVSSVNLNVVTPGYGNTVTFADMAFHPYTNVLYAFDNILDRLITIDPVTGNVQVIGVVQPVNLFGALFFDPFGELYGYTDNNLHHIDIPSGVLTFIATGPSSSGRDGCSCPYTVAFQKIPSQYNVCPGDTFAYTFKIANKTGASMNGVDLHDYLPPQLTILSISKTYGGTIPPGTGVGTSTLEINNMQLTGDTNSLAIQVALDPSFFGGVDLANQAILTDVPVITIDTTYSYDPSTSTFDDSTRVNVYPQTRTTPLINPSGNDCLGKRYTLLGALSQATTTYTWYDAHDSVIGTGPTFTFNSLYYSDTGWYKVHALEYGCTEIWDSIYINVNDCGNTFACTDRFWLSQYSGGQTILNELNYPGNLNLSPMESYTPSLDAFGYNRVDGCFYSMHTTNNRVFRLLKNGLNSNIGKPTGLNTANGGYEAGAVDATGTFVVTGSSGYVAQIQVLQSKAALIGSSALSYSSGGTGTPHFLDIAFHPTTGALYGFDQNTSKLAILNPTTGQVNAFGTVQNGVTVEALFFSTFGDLYAYGGGTLYKFDLSSGTATSLDGGTSSGTFDGCSCPYGVALQKTVTPGAICPGDTIAYTIKLINNTGKPVIALLLDDPLDSRLKITSIQHNLNGQLSGGTGQGTSLFRFQINTLATDTSHVVIKATTAAGYNGGDTLLNQATLKLLPAFFGNEVFSDNPETAIRFDATPLWVAPRSTETIDTTVCSGTLVWASGQWRNTSGTYTDVFTNRFGCDSIITTNLTVNPSYSDTNYVQICTGGQYYAGGQWQNTTGWYTDNYQTLAGCDSIITTRLLVLSTIRDTLDVSICAGEQYYAGGQWQSTPGTYVDSFTSVLGCDSLRITQLSTITPVQTNQAIDICSGDSVFVGGDWQKTPGVYTDTLPSSIGCDTIVSTQLSLTQVITVNRSATICQGESMYVGGGWQSTPGTYSDTVTGSFGCDSIIHTQLTVHSIPVTNLSLSLCEGDSILAGGEWQHQNGTYLDTLTAYTGCDSIVIRQLTFYPIYEDTLIRSICFGDSLFAGGAWQNTAGLYLDQYQTVQGCDSMVYTDLLVTSVVQASWDTTVCSGETVFFAGQMISTPGVYRDTVLAQSGCDSITTFTLSTWSLPQPDLGPDRSICQGDSAFLSVGNFAGYNWSTGATSSTLTVGQAGNYGITVTDNNGCTGSDDVEVNNKPNPTVNLGADVQICPHDSVLLDATNPSASYQWNTGATTASLYAQQAGTYAVTVTMDDCTSSDEILVSHFMPLVVSLQQDTTLCIAESMTLDATTPGAVGYEWSHGPKTPVVDLVLEGTYEVSVTDPNGCISHDDFVLTKEYCRPEVTVPTAFSPNGDGNNDHFLIPNQNITFTELRIYNRWGHQIFQTTDPNEGWDGTYGGEPQPMGVYIVVFRYSDETGRPFLRKGNLTLIR